MDLEICGLNSLLMGSNKFCSSNIKNIPNNKHFFNVTSKNDQCLLYCIAKVLYGKNINISDKKYTKSYKKYIKTFNIKGMTFPTSNKDVKKFAKLN